MVYYIILFWEYIYQSSGLKPMSTSFKINLRNILKKRFNTLFWNMRYPWSYLCPGYPSEYLLFRQEPRASSAARLQKFWEDTQAQCQEPEPQGASFFTMLIYSEHCHLPNITFIYQERSDCPFSVTPQSEPEFHWWHLFSLLLIISLSVAPSALLLYETCHWIRNPSIIPVGFKACPLCDINLSVWHF